MFGRAYISNVSSVDGQAAFLREEAHTDHIAKLRSISIRRALGLPQKLPLKRTMSLLDDFKISELHQHLCDLRARSASSEEIQKANRQFRMHRNTSKKAALDTWKEDWLDERYKNTIQSGGTATSSQSIHTDRIHALFRIMPERARLADMITSDNVSTRDQHLLAVEDLLFLCQRDFEVIYRPKEEPIDKSCSICHMQLSEKARDRSEHIHCGRRSVLKSTSSYVQYCFLCFRWFQDVVTWEEHCSAHLRSMNTAWCGIQTYCHTIISPGHCSFCLSNEQIPASQRLQAWTRNCFLMKHVDNHIVKICFFALTCPHPRCCEQLNSLDLLRHHLGDTYGLIRSQKKAFDLQSCGYGEKQL